MTDKPEFAAILAALDARHWPEFPQKIEMSNATIVAVRRATGTASASDMLNYPFPSPTMGVPVYVDETVPRGQARVSWQDGRTEMIGEPEGRFGPVPKVPTWKRSRGG